MTVSIPLLMLMAIVVFVAYRHMGLKAWHAVACLVLGFLLASTAAAPAINNVLAGILHWAHAQLTGGNGGRTMTDTTSPAPPAEGQPWSVYVGDARAVLAGMPEQSANCIVTSPPYWGKRDYGVPGQYGHEDTPAAYVNTMREVFREARRVLADDGTCWLNLGDSYSASGGGATGMHAYLGGHITSHRATGLGAKNLLGLPWRVALALQADGWILRNAIVWHKPNAMPESVRDRLACRHELIFLLVKQLGYWFDLDPIRVPHAARSRRERRTRPPGHAGSGTRPPKYRPGTSEVTTARRYGTGRPHDRRHPNGRNPGDVWSVPTRPYKGPHFAAYPIDLPLNTPATLRNVGARARRR